MWFRPCVHVLSDLRLVSSWTGCAESAMPVPCLLSSPCDSYGKPTHTHTRGSATGDAESTHLITTPSDNPRLHA